jgi:esterase/lipase
VRKLFIFVTAGIALTITGWALTPLRIDSPLNPLVTITPNLAEGPDKWVQWQDEIIDSAYGIVPGAEQRILWRQQNERTEYAVVYLHGFSASRQEIAPVPEMVAEGLGANLFEARLGGHGLETSRLENVNAEQWIQNAVTALAIGATLGDKIILISTSTGGALSLALLGHPTMSNVDSLIMISPNIEPADPKAKWLTRPAGPLLARLVMGATPSWTARNEMQKRFWTTSYPVEVVVEVMRLVDYANAKLPAGIEQNVLMFVSPDDQVVSPQAARRAFGAIQAPRKKFVEIEVAGDASNHVLAGDIMAPENNERFVAEIVSFVRDAKSRPSP